MIVTIHQPEHLPYYGLLDKVNNERKLSITFPVPLRTGTGNFLYPFAAGSKTMRSAKLLKTNIARFIGSIGS